PDVLAPVESHLKLGNDVPICASSVDEVTSSDDLNHRAPHTPELVLAEALSKCAAQIHGAGPVASAEGQVGTALQLHERLHGQDYVVRHEHPDTEDPCTQSGARVSGRKGQLALHAQNRACGIVERLLRLSVQPREQHMLDADGDIAQT